MPGGQTRLLSPGVVGTNFNGSLNFAANTLSAGDIIRVFAWGTWANPGNNAAGTAQLQLYFPSAALGAPIAQTNAFTIPGNTGTTEWFLLAQITVRIVGAAGTAYCDGTFQTNNGLTGPGPANLMIGAVAFGLGNTITTANALDLTATVTVFGGVILNQCSVEYLPTP
jgi:hypothetical protein